VFLHLISLIDFSAGFRARKYVLSPKNAKSFVVSERSIGGENLSATCLIGVQDNPLLLDIRAGSNTSQDFCNYITMAIEMGFFQYGDFLVYDNAAVHFAEDTRAELHDALERAGIISIPLPVYSPELNPIERCFGVVKQFLRYHIRPEDDLLDSIMTAFAKVTREIVAKEYLSTVAYVRQYGPLTSLF